MRQRKQRLSQDEIDQAFRDLGLDDPAVRRRFQQFSEGGEFLNAWKQRNRHNQFITRRNIVEEKPGNK